MGPQVSAPAKHSVTQENHTAMTSIVEKRMNITILAIVYVTNNTK
jgi:hypothetical protein